LVFMPGSMANRIFNRLGEPGLPQTRIFKLPKRIVMKSMLKFALLTFYLLFSAGNLFSQGDVIQLESEARDQFEWYLRNTANRDVLVKSADLIDEAERMMGAFAVVRVFQTKAKIYYRVAELDLNPLIDGSVTGVEHKIRPHAALDAYKALRNCLTLLTDPYSIGETNFGIKTLMPLLMYEGLFAYDAAQYEDAYQMGLAGDEAFEGLIAAGLENSFDDGEVRKSLVFVGGAGALQTARFDEAYRLLKKAYDLGYKTASEYELYITVSMIFAYDQGLLIWEEACETFPDLYYDFLLAKINGAALAGRVGEAMLSWLEEAIKLDPQNSSLYLFRGGCYESLFNIAYNTPDGMDEAHKNFTAAVADYEKVLKMDPSNASAAYSAAAIRFNRVAMAGNINAQFPVPDEKYVKEFETYMMESLPYFMKAEKLNPNDVNVLSALQAIFEYRGEPKKAEDMKARLAVLDEGGKHEKPYFK